MILRLALPLLLVASLGCGATFLDPMARKSSLKDTQRKYTELIRWGDLERASKFVDPELREEFLSHIDAFDDLEISDYDIIEIDWGEGSYAYGDEESREATEKAAQEARKRIDDEDLLVSVIVNYHGYSEATLLVQEFRETQVWYNDGGKMSNAWRVRPEFEKLIDAIDGETP